MKKENVLFCLIVIVITATISTNHFLRVRGNQQVVESLKSLKPINISRIEVFSDYYGTKRIENELFNSEESKAKFCEVGNDLVTYHANHDIHSKEFFIRVFDASGGVFEFEISLKSEEPGMAFTYLTVPSTLTKGMKSKSLYQWLDYHRLLSEK